MSNYFDKFPEIRYDGVLIRDITKRINFLRNNINSTYVFLPYTVKENEKAEDIAYHYYRDANYDWLVYLSNNMIDPYIDWPMDDFTFDQYIISKYTEKSKGNTGWDVISWTQDETRFDNILYYYKEIGNNNIIKVAPDSFNTLYLRNEDDSIAIDEFGEKIVLERSIPEGWNPYRIYEFERDLNENKRNILLLDRQYLTNVEKEMQDRLQ